MHVNDFYIKLERELPESTAADRKRWSHEIINHSIDLRALLSLLLSEKKVALRFAWLLSELGEINPGKLFQVLPFLFELKDQVSNFDFTISFASYWLLCGVPKENEASAIDLLFDWIQSTNINTTTKSRAAIVLGKLTEKYPDLTNELRLCLEGQKDNYSNDFKKRMEKLLVNIPH